MRRLLKRVSGDGQAAVETAIVAPLFIFMILGMLQFALIYQARAMLKYAAYRAARAGAMQNACKSPMRDVAYSVLLPVIATGDAYLKANSIADYAMGLGKIKSLNMFGLSLVEVRICAPLKSWVEGDQTFHPGNDNAEVDFDDPQNLEATSVGSGTAPAPAAEMRGFERTKLRIQLKYYHKMIIPFANWVIFRTWTGQMLMDELRMGRDHKEGKAQGNLTMKWDKGRFAGGGPRARPNAESTTTLKLLAKSQRYYLPLYANYTFRMQSNLYLKDCPLPKENECWHYNKSGPGTAINVGP